MKKSILFLLFLIGFQVTQAQITKEDYKSIIPLLQAEDWKGAYKLSSKLLKDNPADTSEYKTMVVYLNIYAATGMAAENKIDRKKLNEIVSQYKNQLVFLAGHLASKDDKNTMNKTMLSSVNGKSNGFTTITNKQFKVMLVEDISFAKTFDPAFYQGSFVRCGGKLAEIEVNMDKTNNEWLVKLTVTDAFIRRTK